MHKIGRLLLGYHLERLPLRATPKMTSWYLVVSARLIVQEIHADAKKRGTICTSKCHKGSECQNQPGQAAKLKQGSSMRDRKPEVCACVFACEVNLLQLKF